MRVTSHPKECIHRPVSFALDMNGLIKEFNYVFVDLMIKSTVFKIVSIFLIIFRIIFFLNASHSSPAKIILNGKFKRVPRKAVNITTGLL